MKSRRATLRLKYDGADISADITADLSSATWTDKGGGEADELSVTLHNAHGRWHNDWMPSKGAKLDASIEVQDWGGEGNTAELPCGTFEIDEIELSGGASGSKATIKAVSVPVTSAAKGKGKTKAWQDVTLSVIAGEIASDAGLELFFELDADPRYEREDQSDESDLAFLGGLVRDAGGILKVTHDKLAILSREKREASDAVLTITPAMCECWRFKTKTSGIYKTARVEYHDPELDEDVEYTFDGKLAGLGEGDENGRELVIERRVKSKAEAETLAKNRLAEANAAEVTGSLSMMGDVRLVAGVNVEMEGFGVFDGKYQIKQAAHTLGAKYGVSVELTRGAGQKAGTGGGGGKKSGGTSGASSVKPEKPEAQWKDYSAYGSDIYR